ncbi:MAG: BatD family protein [Verrucomicrobiota bacterium]
MSSITGPAWEPSGLVTNGFTEYERLNFTGRNNKDYSGVIYPTEALATQAGTVTLESANQTATVVVGRSRGFGFFSENVTEDIAVSSNPGILEIQPLPDNAPLSFKGAVGDFKLESKIVPEEVQVGEPITWTLTLSGKGNWPQGVGLPPRNKPSDFQNIQPNLKTEHPDDDLFTGIQIEDIVLIPTKAGEYQLGPVEFSYFDPASETYQTAVIPATTVRIDPITASVGPSVAGQPQSNDPSNDPSNGLPPIEAPVGIDSANKPIELPRDAAAEGYLAPIATGRISLISLVWIPIIPSIAWLFIALIRAFIFDPNKSRRLAHRELKKLSSLPPSLESEPMREHQRRWRQAAKTFWRIPTEEPTADEIAAAVAKSKAPNTAENWRNLWEESDRILYGPPTKVSDNWFAEFRDALNRIGSPSLSLSNFFAPSAWASAVAIAFALAFLSHSSEANQGVAHYNSGEFDKAADVWLQQLQDEPNNWAHRYNLGLSFAQKEDWGRALAYWTSAYALNPRSPELNWNAQLALSKTGAYYPVFKDFLEDKGLTGVANSLSPAEWERLYSSSLSIATCLLLLFVISRYIKRAKPFGLIAAILVAPTLAASVTAIWAHQKYEYLASPKAVIVVRDGQLKSVPADLPQPEPEAESESELPTISTTIEDGSIGLMKKEFLGWFQLELPNGETGWIRKENTVPLYGPVDRL